MKIDRFDFALPEHCIADRPIEPRDTSKLLYIADALRDQKFTDLPSLLRPGDLLICNDTRVIPARLIGKRGEARIEVNLHKQVDDGIWKAFAKPAKKLKEGDVFVISDTFQALVQKKGEAGEVSLAFNLKGKDFDSALLEHGHTPLPPYILSKRDVISDDESSYQTIYAKEPGAVAAPTAGLHFTDRIMESLEEHGIKRAFVTLHVGAGTFLPVKVDDTDDHTMHSEWFSISEETAALVNKTKAEGGRIVAVGTTSLRTVEAASNERGTLAACNGETDIFITPGYAFKIVDLLLTNFHLPRSTLFMLVCAFEGVEKMHQAYRHAIEHNYRFYSYGDACLLERS